MYNIVFIIVVLIIIFALIWYYFRSKICNKFFAYGVIERWGKMLAKVKKTQNSKHKLNNDNNVESLFIAKTCPLKSARKLDKAISKNHDKILEECKSLLDKYDGLPMSKIDSMQFNLVRGSKDWKVLWVKFLDKWAGTSNFLPTLKNIASNMGSDLKLLHISILRPGMVIPLHTGIHSGVWRYHYGLVIPEGNTGLNIKNENYKWKEGEGIIWDDTLLHSAWNKTKETRIIIFADLNRDLHPVANYINNIVTRFIQCSKQIKDIHKLLKSQNP